MTASELALVLASAVLHAIWSATIKGARSPLAFGAAQQLVEAPFALAALALLQRADFSPSLGPLLAATALAHGLYGTWMTLAYQRAELTRVYPIIRATPALLPLLAIPLGERVTPLGALGIAVVVSGVWLVHGAGLSLRRLIAPDLTYAWLTLATTVAYSLADKRAMGELHAGPWHSPVPRPLAWYALLSITSLCVRLPLALRAAGAGELAGTLRARPGGIAASAILGFTGYGLILHVLETAPASYVVAVRQLSVLFTAAIAMRFLGERPGAERLAGAALTVAGVAAIALAG